jgi:hypothetical protein
MLILLVMAMLLFSMSEAANATFIGDEVIVEHRAEGNIPYPWDSTTTTAAIGSEDRVELSAHVDNQVTYGVDIEASSIYVDFLRDTIFTAGKVFHGLYVGDLDWLGGDGFIITDASVTTDNPVWTTEWAAERLDFGWNWVSLDWQGLTVPECMTFAISLTASNPTAPVPEPATMLLLGTGLAGFAGVLRRKRKKQRS